MNCSGERACCALGPARPVGARGPEAGPTCSLVFAAVRNLQDKVPVQASLLEGRESLVRAFAAPYEDLNGGVRGVLTLDVVNDCALPIHDCLTGWAEDCPARCMLQQVACHSPLERR